MSAKLNLLTSVAVAALVVSASSAFSADINQDANNTGPVTTTTGGVFVGDNVSGIAGSASVSATGAGASVGVLGVNTNFISPSAFGTITQTATNNTKSDVEIINSALIDVELIDVDGSLHGHGSSASIGAAGAITSTGVTGIGFNGFTSQTFGNITQTSSNSSDVRILNGNVEVSSIAGRGASASISATGAASSVAANYINSTGNVSFSADGTIRQTTTHSGPQAPVYVSGGIGDLTDSEGGVSGHGASVAVSATGAASQVSAGYINSAGFATIGDVVQVTKNQDNAGTNNNSSSIRGVVGNGFTLKGHGSSASITASGAISSVSLSGINATPSGLQSIGDVTQNTSNAPGVKNSGQIAYLRGLSGDGAAANVSATGAASAISISQIGANGTLRTEVGKVTQTTSMGSGNVMNKGRVLQSLENGLTGDATSVAISATGAVSSVATSYVNSSPRSSTVIGDITQTTTNNAGSVTNSGWITTRSGDTKPVLKGDGASISISATGAGSIVAASFINSGEFDLVQTGTIKQRTENSAEITNSNVVQFGADKVQPATIQTGNISGNVASVSVSATGAASSVSVSSVNNKQLPGTPNVVLGPITQTSINSASITNNGGSISTGTVSGKAASVGINATGAISSVNVASINDAQALGATNVGKITQTTINTGPVLNTGSITTAGLSGNGASVSISAAGAVSAVSFSAIK